MQSDAGTLTLGTAAATAVSNSVTASSRILTLQGASGGNVVGNIIDVGTAVMALTKDGAGTWTLSGTNTSHTGQTTVNGGTLLLNGNAATASGAVTVAVAGTLGGNGIIGGATTVNGRLSPGS